MPNALIIEDDAEFAWLIAKELETKGFSADIVSSLDDSEDRLKRRSYQLVIAAVILRDRSQHRLENTLATMFRVKRAHKPCIVVAISNCHGLKGMEDVAVIARQLGADHVLEKPFDPSEIQQIAAEIVEN